MSKATVVCGSGNPNGVSRGMCDIIMSYLCERGYEISFFDPARMRISHCMDCGGCADGRCVIRDDMDQIYCSYSDSDVMIFCAPIHFSGPSSVIKMVMDRFQKCWFDRDSPHPSKLLVCLCGGSPEPEFNMTERIIKAFCITTGMVYGGVLEIPFTDNGVVDLESKVLDFISDKV